MSARPGRLVAFMRGIVRWCWRVCLLFAGLSLGLVLALRWVDPPLSAFMVQAHAAGVNVRQSWVPMEEIAPAMALAVVAAEDQRFPSHHGFDLHEISDAVDRYRRGGPLRGASTISQQTAKNLFLWPGRNFARKGLEGWFTVLMEGLWPKRRILEVYLNVAEFGPGIYGVGAASRAYFGKEPAALNRHQAVLLAAVLPNPKRYRVTVPGEYVRDRQRWILRQMDQLGDAYLSEI